MEERKKPKYRGIRWVVGLILLLPYMAAYSLVERRIAGKRKWVVIFLGGFGIYLLGMAGLYKPVSQQLNFGWFYKLQILYCLNGKNTI